MVELLSCPEITTALESITILMCSFLSLIVPSRPLFSAVFCTYPDALTPILFSAPAPAPAISPNHTTPLHTYPGSSNHLEVSWFPLSVCRLQIYSHPSDAPNPHPYVLVTPSDASIIACSLVPPLSSPLSATVVSICLPLLYRLDTLDRTGQILSHAPLIACPLLASLYPLPPRLHSCPPPVWCAALYLSHWSFLFFCVFSLGLCISTF